MDIWAWVRAEQRDLSNAGHDDLSADVGLLPGAVLRGETSQVDVISRRLVDFADQTDRPWLAVFARHWRLQSLILFRRQGGRALSTAVDALERACRPESTGCPQRVCTTQDVSLCYAAVDGPGWAEERLAVVDEALASIDATWSCFGCLSLERAAALTDLGRSDEAGAALARWVAETQAIGVALDGLEQKNRSRALFRLGRLDHAREAHDAVHVGQLQEPDRYELLMVQILCNIGLDGAPGVAVDLWGLLGHEAHSGLWAMLAESMVGVGAMSNDLRLSRTLRDISAKFHQLGTNRWAFDVARVATRLAAERGAEWTAQRALEHAETCRQHLRFPEREHAELEQLRALVTSVPPVPCPWPADELAAALDAAEPPVDLELQAAWLTQAVVDRPDDEELLRRWALVCGYVGGSGSVSRELSARLALDPSNTMLSEALMAALTNGGGSEDDFAELAGLIATTQPLNSSWAKAIAADKARNYDAVIASCRTIVTLDPTVRNARRMWAHAAAELDDHEEATRLMREVTDLSKPDVLAEDDWALIGYATRARDWATVRPAADRLGMTVASAEGPIDETWGWVYLRPVGGRDNGADDLSAMRTGPVTARVVQVTEQAGGRQRRGDVVVFDARPLNPRPAERGAEAEAWEPVFREIAVLDEGGMIAWALFGADPGADRWSAFTEAVRSRAWGIWRSTPPGAQIRSEDGHPFDGIYALLACPESESPTEVDAFVRDATDAWPVLVWPHLLAAADRDPSPHFEFWDEHDFV